MESFLNETSSTDLLSQPANESTVILSMVILGLTFLLGLPGNGLVLWVAGLKMQRTVNTVWFLHLTVADFLCCLSLPFSLAHLALQGQWPYGRLLCKFIPSIIVLNMFASVFLLTAISVDRCLLVVKPIWCQNHRSVRAAFVICGCIWVMALAMCIPVFLYREIFTVDNHDICGYNYGVDSSLDFLDFFSDQLENRSPDDSVVQLPGEMDDRSDSSSFQPNDRLWTAPTMNPLISSTDFHAQPSKRPPGDSRNLSRLSSQHTYYTSDLPGFPSEDQRTDSLNDSDPLLFPDSQLFPSTCSNCSDTYDYYNYNFSGKSSQVIYDNQVTKLKVAITMTRLALGFLLPVVIMVVSYTLIVFQIQQGRFSKSRSKTFRVATVVVVVFLICWTPYHIIGVLLLFVGPETPFGEALVSWDHVSIALASANSCLNPFLYALLGKDFRKKARQSMQGILAAAFSEELTHSTSCPQNQISLEKNSISTAV